MHIYFWCTGFILASPKRLGNVSTIMIWVSFKFATQLYLYMLGAFTLVPRELTSGCPLNSEHELKIAHFLCNHSFAQTWLETEANTIILRMSLKWATRLQISKMHKRCKVFQEVSFPQHLFRNAQNYATCFIPQPQRIKDASCGD